MCFSAHHAANHFSFANWETFENRFNSCCVGRTRSCIWNIKQTEGIRSRRSSKICMFRKGRVASLPLVLKRKFVVPWFINLTCPKAPHTRGTVSDEGTSASPQHRTKLSATDSPSHANKTPQKPSVWRVRRCQPSSKIVPRSLNRAPFALYHPPCKKGLSLPGEDTHRPLRQNACWYRRATRSDCCIRSRTGDRTKVEMKSTLQTTCTAREILINKHCSFYQDLCPLACFANKQLTKNFKNSFEARYLLQSAFLALFRACISGM